MHSITWSDIRDAGIDISNVEHRPTSLGVDEYMFIAGDLKIAFGPAVDVENGGTYGWDACTYEVSEGEWEDVRQEWFATLREVLHHVASEIAARVDD